MTATSVLLHEKKKRKAGTGLTILAGLLTGAYSQALSHYRLARDLLPAACRPWAGTILIIQPGHLRTPPGHPY